MGKVKPGRKKSKLIKAAKSAKLDQNRTEYKEVVKSLREQIDEALEYFKSGDVPESKNIIKTVLKEVQKKWDKHMPEDACLLNDCGALLSEIGEEKLAVEALRRSVTISPDVNYEKYITLGQLTSGAESLKYIQRGIELLIIEEKDEKRKLSRAYCNIADLYMTDLCMEKQAQSRCKEAIDQALLADPENSEAYHTMASYCVSSNELSNGRIHLKKGISIWLDDHEPIEGDDQIEIEHKKEKLDPEVRMNALRLSVELEMWNEAVTIARQLSEENYENCEPRYFLAFSLLRMYQVETGNEEKMSLKIDCYEAATDANRLAEKSWRETKDRTAKDILAQIRELLEDLGPVDFQAADLDEAELDWETDEETNENEMEE